MLLWLAQAFAAPTVHVTVTDPDGAVVFDGGGLMPYGESVKAGKTGLYLYVSTFDARRGLMQFGAGRATKHEVKVRVTTSAEMDPYVPIERDIAWKDRTFRVRAVFGDPKAPPDPVPAPETTSRFVRVWDDASLLASPRNPASATRERDLPGGRVDAATEASPFKVVASWAETHLEAETVPAPGPEHCGAGGPPAAEWPLQFYVSREDTAEVVVSGFAAQFTDGSGYVVPPGTPAFRGEPGRARVSSGGLSFEVAVGEGDLGSIYVPDDEVRPPGDAGVSVEPGEVGSTEIGPVTWAGPAPLVVSGIEGGLDAPIAVLRAGCLEVRVPFRP